MAALAILLPLMGIVLGVLIAFVVGGGMEKKHLKTLQVAGPVLGLEVRQVPNQFAHLEGQVDGFPVKVWVEMLPGVPRPSQKTPETRIRTGYGFDLGKNLMCAGKNGKFFQQLKARDLPPVPLLDRAFAERFVIGAAQPGPAVALFTDPVRAAITSAEADAGGVVLDDTGVLSVRSNLIADPKELVAIVRAQVVLARTLKIAWGPK